MLRAASDVDVVDVVESAMTMAVVVAPAATVSKGHTRPRQVFRQEMSYSRWLRHSFVERETQLGPLSDLFTITRCSSLRLARRHFSLTLR